jgi:hypothetical protein
VVDGVHADAVAEQRAAGLARDGSTARCDLQLVVLVEAEAAHQLVGERDLPAPPVPVMPSTGDDAALRLNASFELPSRARLEPPFSSAVIRREQPRSPRARLPRRRSAFFGRPTLGSKSHALDHVVDHALQAQGGRPRASRCAVTP